MSKLATLATQLPGAEWDLVSFFDNAKVYLNTIGGGLISLLGLAILIWAGVLIAKKFFGGQSAQQESWFKIVAMLLIGGALMWGGIALITTIAQGGEKTVKDLGGGFILLSGLLG